MTEKVNPMHPDKIADRIAGAIVDLAYKNNPNPKVAVEVLIGHGVCHIIAETSADIDKIEVCRAVHRISKRDDIMVDFKLYCQDEHLAKNQSDNVRCVGCGPIGAVGSDRHSPAYLPPHNSAS